MLDLLAGWASFVDNDEQNQILDAVVSAEEIGALYQSAGRECEAWEGMSAEEQESAVRAFVEERIMPLLLRREVAGDAYRMAA